MPLEDASLIISATYNLATPVTGFNDRTQEGSIAFGGSIDVDEWDQSFAEQFTLSTTSPDAEIDLYSFVNQVCEAVVGARVLGGVIQVASSGDVVNILAGVTNPLAWFATTFPGGVVISGNGTLGFQDEDFSALSPTSRNLHFELDGGTGDAVVTVIIYLSTTP